MSDTRRRPFWKRKRWIAAAVVWLVAIYPLSLGPAMYAVLLGWMDSDTCTAYRVPWDSVTPYLPDRLNLVVGEYLMVWIELAGPEPWSDVTNRR